LGGSCSRSPSFFHFFLCLMSDNNLGAVERKCNGTSEFFQPATYIVEGGFATDIINNEGTNSTPIVSGSHSTETLLTGSVPDLSLDLLAIDLHTLSLKLHTDGGFGIQVEFVACVSGKQIGLADGRVPYQHHLEQIVLATLLIIIKVSCHFPPYPQNKTKQNKEPPLPPPPPPPPNTTRTQFLNRIYKNSAHNFKSRPNSAPNALSLSLSLSLSLACDSELKSSDQNRDDPCDASGKTPICLRFFVRKLVLQRNKGKDLQIFHTPLPPTHFTSLHLLAKIPPLMKILVNYIIIPFLLFLQLTKFLLDVPYVP